MSNVEEKNQAVPGSAPIQPGYSKPRSVLPRIVLPLVAALILVTGFYFARRSGSDSLVYRNDFNVYYHAAREVLAGRDPYQSSLGDWTPYLYPPLLALLLTPLALLALPVAAYVWFLINAVSTSAAAWMSARLACDNPLPRDANQRADELSAPDVHSGFVVPLITAGALLVVARFVLDNFNLGQVNPVVAALVAAHTYLYSKGRNTASAIALAIAASFKLTPLVLIGYHVARRRWKFAAACLGLFLTITALSFLSLGRQAPDALGSFVNRTIRNEQGFDLSYAGNQSLRGAVARLTPVSNDTIDQTESESSRRSSDTATLILSLALVAVAMIAARRARTELLAAAPFVCCIALLSPLSWKAHFVVLIFPIASLVVETARSRGTQRAILITVLAVVFVFFNLTSPRVIGLQAAEWADAHSLVFIGALLIFASSVWAAGFARKR